MNGNFTHWNYFGPGWYGNYPGAWWPGRWAVAATAWSTATWALAGSYCGCTGDPMYYDYGNGVNYQDDTVYYGDQPVASADQYYDQAVALRNRPTIRPRKIGCRSAFSASSPTIKPKLKSCCKSPSTKTVRSAAIIKTSRRARSCRFTVPSINRRSASR